MILNMFSMVDVLGNVTVIDEVMNSAEVRQLLWHLLPFLMIRLSGLTDKKGELLVPPPSSALDREIIFSMRYLE
jgi:hypothetical protein